jgi:SAM-dependent methyltransferase
VCGSCGAIQKVADQAWFDEVATIYGAYEIYHLSDGAEQVIYEDDATTITPRSHRLVDFLVQTVALPPTGRLLDIGCGNGAALANFSRALPNWVLFGSELDEKNLPILRRLPNFGALFTGSPCNIPGTYGLVSLIHSLEHMPDPLRTLRDVASKIADGGWLFIQVPDTYAWPFDLLVADHLLHFTTQTLCQLIHRAGFAEKVLTDTVVKKELTFIGYRNKEEDGSPPHDPAAARALVVNHLHWLQDVIVTACSVADAGKSFGILGTSISGIWLFGVLGDKVDFFVDEDPSRIGRSYQGRRIYRPEDVPPGSDVFVPLIPDIAAGVDARCARLTSRFHMPPPYRERAPFPRAWGHHAERKSQ